MAWYWWIAILVALPMITLLFMHGATRNNSAADEAAREWVANKEAETNG